MKLLKEMMTKTDELGAAINKVMSPDLLNNRDGATKDLWDADFSCNITTPTNLIGRLDIKPSDFTNKKIDLDGMYIFFMCLTGKLTPKRMFEYLSKTCGSALPSWISVGNVEFFGTFATSRGYDGDDIKKYDLYLIRIGISDNIDSFFKNSYKILIDDSKTTLSKIHKAVKFQVRFGSIDFLSKML